MRINYWFVDLTGQKFGRLTALERAAGKSPTNAYWLCQCDCGTKKVVRAQYLPTGHTQSCGCLRREKIGNVNKTHGMTKTPEFNIFVKMKQRCENPKDKGYRHYGARGIRVEWDNFEQFLADMGPRPSPKHSIERKSNDGPYAAWNCRWATQKEQMNNQRRNNLITYQGETLTLTQWAERLGYQDSCKLWARIYKLGWSVERAFTRAEEPVHTIRTRIIEYNGMTLTLTEWAKRLGHRHTRALWARLYELGWSVEKSLSTPVRPRSH